ncbi:MAG: glycosyltransferase [Flavobacteriaceae bacterium]|nr:glycosyltransferase [Flavobacteriaceae bacterium]
MISILIPTYDRDAVSLVSALEKQALKAGIQFELICIDDGSFSHHNERNQSINSMTNCKFIENKSNLGRNANRHLLAKQAQYKWLLFLDADTMPKTDDFIKNYLDVLNEDYDAFFGGFAYHDQPPGKDHLLRYTFGKHREEVPADERNKKPFKVIISANFLIKKEVFLSVNRAEMKNLYGLDYLFGALLKQNDFKVYHIDNEVFHQGIDNNSEYLEKTRKAVETLNYISRSKRLEQHEISLLRAKKLIERLGLTKTTTWLYKKFESRLEMNLRGNKPSMLCFDLYRLGYLCSLAYKGRLES